MNNTTVFDLFYGQSTGNEWNVSTASPAIEDTTATSLALAGIIIGILLAILLLFALALAIDCRNKKLAESQNAMKPKRKTLHQNFMKLPQFIQNGNENGDNISFVNKMYNDAFANPPLIVVTHDQQQTDIERPAES